MTDDDDSNDNDCLIFFLCCYSLVHYAEVYIGCAKTSLGISEIYDFFSPPENAFCPIRNLNLKRKKKHNNNNNFLKSCLMFFLNTLKS